METKNICKWYNVCPMKRYLEEGELDKKWVVGKLGEISFKEGDYIYFSSAKGCLETRLQRHLMKDKRIFWHIEYLLENQKAKIVQIWTIDKKKTEKILKEMGFFVFFLL